MNSKQEIRTWVIRVFAIQLLMALCLPAIAVAADDAYYTEPRVFELRPTVTDGSDFGHLGATGLLLSIDKGVVLKVEGATPGTPADGKFKKGDIILGVNGVAHKGRNVYVVMGEALTAAEAKDGKLVFEVSAGNGEKTRQVEVVIPVLGAYSPTWPLNCRKSQTIIKNAAAYYAKNMDMGAGLEGALVCLFLLSTGDDQYLPLVKARLEASAEDVKESNNTWHNGYNGIAYCEYYLRTGDQSVLPVIQALCDNARDRQLFGLGWTHNGYGARINYGHGLLNAASGPVVMSLLLAKQCPVTVDDATLLGSLKFWYRFSGHGTVNYGDHRPEGGLGSNGMDGMGAVIMQLACNTTGDVGIYQQARNGFAASMIDSYPCFNKGHGDWGRGDAIWRGISASYYLGPKPVEYQTAMNRMRWWYDMSRRPSGGIGIALLDEKLARESPGAAVALGYTAPLKTLCITGAPRSKFAKDFTLPATLWGRKADLAFLSIEHAAAYKSLGAEMPVHDRLFNFGSKYLKPSVDVETLKREEIYQGICHRNFVFRVQAAKALQDLGAYNELEKLLYDPDPRIRRAGLDGIIGYNYTSFDKNPIPANKITPETVATFRKMLADPDEALFVVDSVLMAMSLLPVKEIVDSLPLIVPWTTCDEWWLRRSASMTLITVARDPAHATKVLPILGDMLPAEERPSARVNMLERLADLAKGYKPDSEPGKMISTICQRATKETKIISGHRATEGGYHIAKAILHAIDYDPKNTLELAQVFKARLAEFETGQMAEIADKFLLVLEQDVLSEAEIEKLSELLYTDVRPEFLQRMGKGDVSLNTLAGITSLKNESAAWRDIAKPTGNEWVWKYHSLVGKEDDGPYPTLEAGLEKWYAPDFNDSKWASGKAPIGKGKFNADPRDLTKSAHIHRSPWGEGDYLLMRTTFEVDSLDYDFFRATILYNQRFKVYLNGKSLCEHAVRNEKGYYQPFTINGKNLKKGKNVLAAYARVRKKTDIGHFDMRLQGLRKADLLQDTEQNQPAGGNAAPKGKEK